MTYILYQVLYTILTYLYNTNIHATLHTPQSYILYIIVYCKAETKIGDLSLTLLSGFLGAIFATCFNAPFDVSELVYAYSMTVYSHIICSCTILAVRILYALRCYNLTLYVSVCVYPIPFPCIHVYTVY